ncbi:MAG: helix-turn-helix domain-containing protein [bacterium]
MGVHRCHLEKEWRRECGRITPKQLLIGLKLHYSSFLMQNEGLKLKDIAWMAGYANEHEFYRSFHRHMGITASRYRRDYVLPILSQYIGIGRERSRKVSFLCNKNTHNATI